MNVDTYSAQFEALMDSSEAVQRVRDFALDLATRGRLTSQLPADGSAADVLDRIAIASKQARAHAPVSHLPSDAEMPFSLPETWRWTTLISVLRKLTDGTHHSPPNGPTGDYKYITAKNIKEDGVYLDNVTYIQAEVHKEIYARCNPEYGDILYIKDGATTGIATINDLNEPFSLLSSVALLKPREGVFNRYLVLALRSPFFYSQMRSFMKGAAITRVTLKRMAPALLPLPPETEQHRIVESVGKLMTLCNSLEIALANRDRFRARVLGALINNAVDDTNALQHAKAL
jgi:type I restriction enzyme S subunit